VTEPQKDLQQSFLDLLDSTRAHLAHEREDGLETVEMQPLPASRSPAAPRPSPPATTAPTRPEPGLEAIARRVAECRACPLCEGRTRTVPGQGSPHPDVLFVGEGPGYEEDKQGVAFVGRAGQLLTRIIEAMGYTRDEVFIANIVKCRPPGNRTPLPDEMAACLPYLKEQIALLRPKVVVALGATALKGLLDVKGGITKLRGTWLSLEGLDVMPTYHPAYLLRNPAAKGDVWEDMKAVLAQLGRKPPARKKRATGDP